MPRLRSDSASSVELSLRALMQAAILHERACETHERALKGHQAALDLMARHIAGIRQTIAALNGHFEVQASGGHDDQVESVPKTPTPTPNDYRAEAARIVKKTEAIIYDAHAREVLMGVADTYLQLAEQAEQLARMQDRPRR